MKKSIGIIIPSLKKYGGAERYMIELCRYIQEDYKITLYAPDINSDFLKEHGVADNVSKVKIRDAFPPEKEKYHFILNSIVIAKYWKQEIGNHDLYLCNTFPSHLIDKRPMLWFPHEPMRGIHDLKYEGRVEKRGKEISLNLHVYPKVRYDDLKDRDFEAITDTIKAVDSSVIPELTVANSKYCAQYIKESLNIDCDGYIYPGCDQNPYSNIKKDPQAPGPVRTGERIAIKCSCPEPLLIQIPGILLKICFGCWASNFCNSEEFIDVIDIFLDHPLRSVIFFSKTIISSST